MVKTRFLRNLPVERYRTVCDGTERMEMFHRVFFAKRLQSGKSLFCANARQSVILTALIGEKTRVDPVFSAIFPHFGRKRVFRQDNVGSERLFICENKPLARKQTRNIPHEPV